MPLKKTFFTYAVIAAALFLFVPVLVSCAYADGPAAQTPFFTVSTPVPTPVKTAVPVPTVTPAPEPFSLIFLPDTQLLVYHESDLLEKVGEGVKAHIRSDNAIAVLHAGDMVDNGLKEWQWDAFSRLLGPFYGTIPFLPVAGNHDMGNSALSYKAFVAHADTLLRDVPEDARFEGGIVYYKVLEAGNEKLLLIGASYDALRTKEAFAFVDGVMEKYGDLPCILLMHGFLTRSQKGHVLHHNYVEEENVVKKYPNIRMVLCGHANHHVCTDLNYDDDGDGVKERTVHAMMLNYGTSHYYAYCVLTFDPVSRSVSSRTYSADPDTPVKCTKPHLYGPIDFTWENAF